MSEIETYEELQVKSYNQFTNAVYYEVSDLIYNSLKDDEREYNNEMNELRQKSDKCYEDGNYKQWREIGKTMERRIEYYEQVKTDKHELINKLGTIRNLRRDMEQTLKAYDEIETSFQDIVSVITRSNGENAKKTDEKQMQKELHKLFQATQKDFNTIYDKLEEEVKNVFNETRELADKTIGYRSFKIDSDFLANYSEDRITLKEALDIIENFGFIRTTASDTRDRSALKIEDMAMSPDTSLKVETVEQFEKYSLSSEDLVITSDKQYTPYKLAINANKSLEIMSKNDRKVTSIDATLEAISKNGKEDEYQKTIKFLTKFKKQAEKKIAKADQKLEDNGYSVIQDTVESQIKLEEERKQRERFEEERRLNELREDELRQKRYEQLFSFDDERSI